MKIASSASCWRVELIQYSGQSATFTLRRVDEILQSEKGLVSDALLRNGSVTGVNPIRMRSNIKCAVPPFACEPGFSQDGFGRLYAATWLTTGRRAFALERTGKFL